MYKFISNSSLCSLCCINCCSFATAVNSEDSFENKQLSDSLRHLQDLLPLGAVYGFAEFGEGGNIHPEKTCIKDFSNFLTMSS